MNFNCTRLNDRILGNNSLRCTGLVPTCDCRCLDQYCFTQNCTCSKIPTNTTTDNYVCSTILKGTAIVGYSCNYKLNQICSIVNGTQNYTRIDNFTEGINYKSFCNILPVNTTTSQNIGCNISIPVEEQLSTSWTGRDLAVSASCNTTFIQSRDCNFSQTRVGTNNVQSGLCL